MTTAQCKLTKSYVSALHVLGDDGRSVSCSFYVVGSVKS